MLLPRAGRQSTPVSHYRSSIDERTHVLLKRTSGVTWMGPRRLGSDWRRTSQPSALMNSAPPITSTAAPPASTEVPIASGAPTRRIAGHPRGSGVPIIHSRWPARLASRQ